MLYDAYVVKMKKLVKIRNWIIKYKFLLLAIAVIILAGTISFLASIGSISIVNDCKEEIVYGEKIKFEASAFLKEVTYEYRGDGIRQWTTELPIYPGEYEVRGVAKGFFGNNKYTESQEFKILPKEVTLSVSTKTVQYGDNISLSGSLISGDKAYIEGLTNKLTTLQNISINNDRKVTIYNNAGKDVTECYNYTIVPTTVSVTKRNVTISVESISKDYDGKPLESDQYKITSGSILDTDKLNITFDKSITLAGSINNTPTCVVYNSNNIDVSSLYNIIYKPIGTLLVNKANIKIETGSQTFEYDGTLHAYPEYELKTKLAEGHTIEVVNSSTITNVGTTDNILEVVIRNSSGVDVTSCYNIEYTKGKLEVTKRAITIESGSETFTYNGIVQSYLEYTITSNNKLCNGDVITPISNVNAINVGSYENELSYAIRNSYGEEITNNYDIKTTNGTITITKLPITIETGSVELIYNGENQSYHEYTVISENKIPSVDSAGIDTFTEIKNVGQIENQLTVKISNNKFENVTNNYEITYVYGYIKIAKRPVTIVTATSSHVYDDKDYKDETYTTSSQLGIVESHQVEVQNAPTIKYVGTITNNFSVIIKDNNGEEVTSNYDLSYDYGTLEVTKRPLTITTDTIEHTYDATTFKDVERNMITKTDLEHDITYKANVFNEIKNVGEVDNICEVLDIKDSTGYSVLNNYEITYNFGKLIVIPRPITVITGSMTKEYDGTPLVYENADVTNLVSGHQISYYNWSSITNVGRTENNFDSIKILEGAEDVTNNYVLTVECGTLEITPRLITIISKSATKIYDGSELYEREYDIYSGSVAPSQDLTITDSTTICNVGTITNEILATIVTDQFGNDVTSNYLIGYLNNGTLEVTKRFVFATTNSNEWIYDGTDYYDYGYSITEGSLVNGELFVPIDYTTIRNCGSVNNIVTYSIIKEDGSDSTDNYRLQLNYGTLNVTKRIVTIKPVDLEKEYDDTPLVPTNYEVLSELDIPTTHFVEVDYSGSITNVGTAPSYITNIIVTFDNQDATSNFEFIKLPGTLEITPRIIETTPKTITHIYNGQYQDNSKTSFVGDVRVVEGHTFEVYLELVSLKNVGQIEFDYYITSIHNDLGQDVTSNYQITSNKGILEIIPRDIYIYTKDYTKEYDGKYISSLDIELSRSIDLVDGQEIIYKDNYTNEKNVGSYQNYLEVSKIIDTNNYNEDVTNNYKINYRYGTITITPRELKFKTFSDQKEYDGTPLKNSSYSLIGGSLAPNEFLEVLGSTEVTEFTKGIPNELIIMITNSNGEETTFNYNITYEHGYLSILKRDISIKTGSISEVYTSNAYSNEEYSYNDLELVSTDRIEIESAPQFITVGKFKNEITFRFYNKDNKNVSHCYNVIGEYGDVEITSRHIIVETHSASKKYDGTELVCKDYTLSTNYPAPNDFAIGPNDTANVVEFTSVINIGQYMNVLKLQILDKNDKDVTYCYSFDYIYGVLEILENPYIPESPNAVITFDDVAKRIEYESDKQVWAENNITVTSTGVSQFDYNSYYAYQQFNSNHKVLIEYEAGIKKAVISSPYYYSVSEEISIPNATIKNYYNYTEIIFDETVTSFEIFNCYFRCYSISIYEGEKQEEEDGNENGGGGNGNLNGNLDREPGQGTGGGEGSEPFLVFKFTANYEGLLYFRQASFGDYTEADFADAVHFDFSAYNINPLYLVSKALEEYGFDKNQMEISVLVDDLILVIPYYSTSSRDDQNDCYLNKVKISSYLQDFIAYDSIPLDIQVSDEYKVLEQVYRQFVYENYLQIPISTKGTLDYIISENNFDKNSPTIIQDVQNFLLNFGKYNLNFEKYPAGCDIVSYFLEEAKEGICQHYAAAGTMLYRALGIPARYTVGYTAYSSYGEETYVDSIGHAWVEVYIDGLGWVPVEVTNGTTEAPSDEEPEIIEISLKPIDRVKEYDGITLYPYTVDDIGNNGIYQILEGTDEFNNQLFENLVSQGYTYYVEISGEQKEVGISDSIIDKIYIYDPEGIDVTKFFVFELLPGKLEVCENLITIYAYNYTKYYDGTVLTASNSYVYKVEGLENKYELSYDLIGSIVNVGSIEYELANIVLRDHDGNDITSSFKFEVIGKLVVKPRKITVSSGSSIKSYDEEPLTNSNYYISIGELVEGHQLVAETNGTITNPGHVDNEFTYIKVFDQNNNDITLNYNINESFGILEIID